MGGYWLAHLIDTNIAGAMASMAGVYFLLALVFAPEQGLVARQVQQYRRRRRFAVEMLLVHLRRHENTAAAGAENSLSHLISALNWSADYARDTVQRASQNGLIQRENGHLLLTEQGRDTAQRVLAR